MFRQEINLYRSFSSPNTMIDFLPWRYLWVISIIFSCFLFLIYLLSLWDVHQLNRKKTVDLQKITALKTTFTQIKSHYPQLFFTQDVHQSVSVLQHDLSTQATLLESITNRTPFSLYLLTLAQLIVANVWLTEISISNNGQEFVLKGESMSMRDLQTFIGNITHEKTFANSTLHVSNVENKKQSDVNSQLTFEINISKKP